MEKGRGVSLSLSLFVVCGGRGSCWPRASKSYSLEGVWILSVSLLVAW